MKYWGLIFTFFMAWTSWANASDRPDVVTVCTHLGFEPYVIHSGQDLSGIDIEIVEIALTKSGLDYDLQALPWARLIAALKNGNCDIGLSLFDRQERRNYAKFVFEVPIHTSNIRVFSLKDHPLDFEKVSDLFGLRVAHNRGFSLTYELDLGVEARHIQRISYDHPQSALNMLFAGRIDVILENEMRIWHYLKDADLRENVISQDIPFLSHEPAFLVVSKQTHFDADRLHEVLKKALIDMEKSGKIQEITDKYRF